MKICIVTVYDSINSGSYWQARALGDVITQLGHDVVYLERIHNKKNGFSVSALHRKNFFKAIIKLEWNRAIRIYSNFHAFKKEQGIFKTVTYDRKSLQDIDCIVLGSDTIWNLDSKYFADTRLLYWGGLFKDKRILTYAGSVANTSLQTVEHFTELKDYVNGWDFISVRDKQTYDIISALTNKLVYNVCDPTLLLRRDDYAKMVGLRMTEPYIFLYLFEDLSKNQIVQLREFASSKNLKIISGIEREKYSDEMIVNSPIKFLEYMFNAVYVITDTFHGTVFSVNLQRQFVSINRNKNKVNDFLKEASFEDRLISEHSSMIETLTTQIDYAHRMGKVDEMRKQSLDYLSMALNKE